MRTDASPTGSGAARIEVAPCTREHDEERDALVRGAPGASVFHLAAWRRFVEETYALASHDLGAWRDGRLIGLLPLTLCRGIAGGPVLVSVPFAVYGGPIASDGAATVRLVERACRLAEELRVRHLELRCEEDPGVDLPASDLYATFVRDLPSDVGGVLAGMPKKARAVARRARRVHGLELTEGAWYVDDLCRLFLANKRSLGSPGLPSEHFEGLLRHLGPDAFVHVVHRSRYPLAAVMSFALGPRLVAYYAGTEPGADREFGASNFMYMALQEWAVERGFCTFDFSRSRVGTGAFRFKVHQGFEARPLHYRYHLVRARRVPSFTPSNPRTALLRRAWSRLPTWVARRLSRTLAPRLP